MLVKLRSSVWHGRHSRFSILALIGTLAAGLPGLAMADPVPDPGNTPLGNPDYIAVLVRIPIPPGLDREKVVALMKQSVPQFKALPGLVRKYYTISDDNRAGGVYLFTDRASAQRHFDAKWVEGISKTYGAAPDVIYLSSPIQISRTGS